VAGQLDSASCDATVTVLGCAVVRAEPDDAVLWITLSQLADAPGPSLADVSSRGRALVALLDELGVADTDRSTIGVTVHEEFDHTPSGRRSLGHRAVSRVAVRLADPELIGRLITRATESLSARIDGPRWLISPDNPARLRAARLAAADARRRAAAYAEGVGATLGPAIQLSESEQQMSIRAAGGLKPMAASESIPIDHGEHEGTATVRATFALEPG